MKIRKLDRSAPPIFLNRPGRQAARYLTVGVMSAAVYLVGTWFFVDALNLHVIVWTGIAYALGTTLNYLGNFYWAFGRAASHLYSMPRYLSLVIVGFVYNEAITAAGVLGFGFEAWLSAFVAASTWPILCFAILRVWVFAPAASFGHAQKAGGETFG